MNLGYGHRRQELQGWDKKYVWHPFTHLVDWLQPEYEIPVITGGEGPYIFDIEGRRVIDGNSSIWCNIHGHRHPRITEALLAQTARFSHASFLGYTHPPGIMFSKRLIEDYLGKWGFSRVFFSESGSNAIEAALRMALQWQALSGRSDKREFLAFGNSYHGDSLGSLSVTGLGAFKKYIPPSGYVVTRLKGADELTAVDGNDIAAVILEPLIAGAAGMRPWPKGMLTVCRDWCLKNEILMIHDEVFTGFGRTGEMFAFEHERCPADILVLGKALSGGTSPLSATIVNSRVFDVFAKSKHVADAFLYGHSYSAHAPGCAAGIASLDVFRDEAVLDRTRGLIGILREVLETLNRLPLVAEVRQCGFIGCVEVIAQTNPENDYGLTEGKMVVAECWKLGLATRAMGNSIVLLLPLCADEKLVRRSGKILGLAIRRVYREIESKRVISAHKPVVTNDEGKS